MAVAFVDSKTLKNFKINWLTFPKALLYAAKMLIGNIHWM